MTLYYLGNRSKLEVDTHSDDGFKTGRSEPTTNCTSICSDFYPDHKQKDYNFGPEDIIEEQKSELEESPVKMASEHITRKSTLVHPMIDLDNFVPSFV